MPLGPLGQVLELATDIQWNAEDLARAIGASRAVLQAAGMVAGDNIVICHGGNGRFFADLMAVWSLGGCAACLNPAITKPELENICALLSPRATLVGGQDQADASAMPPRLFSGSTETEIRIGGADGEDPCAGLDLPAVMLFTSGTTGTPKGVVHTFRSLLARVALNRQFIGDEALARTLCVLPTHFGHGLIGNCLTPLLAGHRLALAPVGDPRTAASLGEVIDAHRIGFMSAVPAFWKLVIRMSKPPTTGCLRRVHVGSSPLSADLWNEIIAWSGTRNVVNMYGITESANWVAGASAAEFDPADGLIGRMWGGFVAVRRDNGDVATEGEGELLIQSPSLMSGYYQLDEQTAAVLRDGWFHTGDIGSIDLDGTMRLTGRIKTEINKAGIKIHPEDIDLLLERHVDVAEACAFGYDDDLAGQLVGVAVTASAGARIDIDSLRKWARQRLVQEKLPDRWYVIDRLPSTDRGKVSRQAVAKHCLALGSS